ncbi:MULTISPECIES: hypothetical protein [Acidithrix]|uniref:ACT domain-containing protein n=1 Tax=Acidithrix ferrooxidans TaxID=1280514 RepID=A0A0D8HGV8_9ACTN|nr:MULTISPECIES: hypothetical protein [Acidithrix]KJF17230.1 hypothetical protein AXFE_19430 [Acidithrix ferrooxidans]
MAKYVMRIWLDDRPGALGAVASRIGSVKGDLVGIEILERGGGKAIDEIIVEISNPDLLDLVIREIHEVDGVDVEDVRPWPHDEHDIRLAPLEIATRLIDEQEVDSLLMSLTKNVLEVFELTWCGVVDIEKEIVTGLNGQAPPLTWICAYALGGSARGTLDISSSGSEEIMLYGLDYDGLKFVVAREGRPFRALERSQIWMIARICGQHAKLLRLVSL